MKARVVALVPMRHDSKRVPGKNYRPFVGRPLYQHIIKSLLDCPLITEVIIDTDSPTIMEDASGRFPEVRRIERLKNLRADTVPMNDVLLHDVTQVESDYYLQTHSTNPLLSTETITRAIELFIDKHPSYDSLFSVTRMQKRLWDGQARAINHDPSVLLRTQDLQAVYEENSCIYIFNKSSLEARGNRIGKRPFMFEIDPVEAWDIDDELDFRIAEFFCQERTRVRA
ncbi:MAG: acylneuraminate cytidylyltransferase family protein [Planctomycetota bacterium]|jgi:CMP-N-acetylneuraminic acid synthetase